jgi:hypothetical protein
MHTDEIDPAIREAVDLVDPVDALVARARIST